MPLFQENVVDVTLLFVTINLFLQESSGYFFYRDLINNIRTFCYYSLIRILEPQIIKLLVFYISTYVQMLRHYKYMKLQQILNNFNLTKKFSMDTCTILPTPNIQRLDFSMKDILTPIKRRA